MKKHKYVDQLRAAKKLRYEINGTIYTYDELKEFLEQNPLAFVETISTQAPLGFLVANFELREYYSLDHKLSIEKGEPQYVYKKVMLSAENLAAAANTEAVYSENKHKGFSDLYGGKEDSSQEPPKVRVFEKEKHVYFLEGKKKCFFPKGTVLPTEMLENAMICDSEEELIGVIETTTELDEYWDEIANDLFGLSK